MISPEKIASIKKRAKNGYPAGELRAELEAESYSKEEIDACFPAHVYDMSVWYFVFAVLVFFAGAALSNGLLLLLSGCLFLSFYFERKRVNRKKGKAGID